MTNHAKIVPPAGMEQPDAYSYQLGIDAARSALKALGAPTTNKHIESVVLGFLGATLTAVSSAGGNAHTMRDRLVGSLKNAVTIPQGKRH